MNDFNHQWIICEDGSLLNLTRCHSISIDTTGNKFLVIAISASNCSLPDVRHEIARRDDEKEALNIVTQLIRLLNATPMKFMTLTSSASG